jgi:hypothetical protein
VTPQFSKLWLSIAFGLIFGPQAASSGPTEVNDQGIDFEASHPSSTHLPAHGQVAATVIPKTAEVNEESPSAKSLAPKSPGSYGPSRAEISEMVERLARRHRLDVDLVHSVIAAESAYDPRAVSHAGAVGLMQVMPATASDYGIHSTDALFDPSINLETGMRHFKRLLDKYGNIGQAVMAYNAGEGALERSGGFVTYAETQRYTHAVVLSYLRKKGVEPYTTQARQAVGIDVTPAMAQASSGSKGQGASGGAEASVTNHERVPVTRLTSRLSPGLSRRSDAGLAPTPAKSLGRPTAASPGLASQSRLRFAGDAR